MIDEGKKKGTVSQNILFNTPLGEKLYNMEFCFGKNGLSSGYLFYTEIGQHTNDEMSIGAY